MVIEQERVKRVLDSYVDQCILEAIRTECPQIKDYVHGMVKSMIKNESRMQAWVKQFGVKDEALRTPEYSEVRFADAGGE